MTHIENQAVPTSTLAERIVAKEAEIVHYEEVLARYGSGRWYDQGRRHLADLRGQLVALRAAGTPTDALLPQAG